MSYIPFTPANYWDYDSLILKNNNCPCNRNGLLLIAGKNTPERPQSPSLSWLSSRNVNRSLTINRLNIKRVKIDTVNVSVVSMVPGFVTFTVWAFRVCSSLTSSWWLSSPASNSPKFRGAKWFNLFCVIYRTVSGTFFLWAPHCSTFKGCTQKEIYSKAYSEMQQIMAILHCNSWMVLALNW